MENQNVNETTAGAIPAVPPPAYCSASFARWTEQRGVWPRLTHEEIWNTAWRAAMESIWERLPMPAFGSDPMTPREVEKLLAYVKSNLPNASADGREE